MAWYNGTFSCGCEGRVNVIGPCKTRQWKIDNAFSKPCEECRQKAFEEKVEKENKEAASKASEMELPELTGSEKQVIWGNTLRVNLIETLENSFVYIGKFENQTKYFCLNNEMTKRDMEIFEAKLLDTTELIDFMINHITNAKWYIDNRDSILTILSKLNTEYVKYKNENTAEAKIEKKLIEDIKFESTVIPENATTKSVAEIKFDGTYVKVYFEKDNKFIEIVKNLGYSWKGVWQKNINELTGTYQDRMSELGNALLNKGYPIIIDDAEIRNNAINGMFEHECDRWIRESNNNLLRIKWYDKSDLYNVARKLKGTSYKDGTVYIKVEQWEELQEFVEMYGFKYTKAAQQMIEEYKLASKLIEIVTPISNVKVEKNGLTDILNSSDDILGDLMDD